MTQQNILTNGGAQQLLDQSKVDNILNIVKHIFKEFLHWWYIKMSIWHLRMLGRISLILDDNLSISLLLKNFFLPWHRDFSLIGYVFGVSIKILFLPIAIFTYLLFTLIYILAILLWLVLPPVTLFFIFKSLMGI